MLFQRYARDELQLKCVAHNQLSSSIACEHRLLATSSMCARLPSSSHCGTQWRKLIDDTGTMLAAFTRTAHQSSRLRPAGYHGSWPKY